MSTALLAGLLREWGEFYVITYSGTMYHAERRDNGARVHEADPAQLRQEIEADFTACPVMTQQGHDLP